MYTQIFLGIMTIAKGILLWSNSRLAINKKMSESISEPLRRKYQKRLAISHFLLGFLFIIMAIVEKKNILPTALFAAIYIALVIIPLGLILIFNKKYTGYYFFF